MEWYSLLIQKYGYLGILLGTLVEGEIFLALGGLFARQGLLNIWLVMALATIGSFSGHCLFFLLGKWRGPSLLCRFQKLRAGYPEAHALAQRFGPACIFIAQYLYGLRLITAFTIGSLGLRVRVFVFWQIFSISCWALGLTLAGYLFGTAIEYFVTRLEILLTLVLGVAVVMFLIYRRFRHWARENSGAGHHPGGAFLINPDPCLSQRHNPAAKTDSTESAIPPQSNHLARSRTATQHRKTGGR